MKIQWPSAFAQTFYIYRSQSSKYTAASNIVGLCANESKQNVLVPGGCNVRFETRPFNQLCIVGRWKSLRECNGLHVLMWLPETSFRSCNIGSRLVHWQWLAWSPQLRTTWGRLHRSNCSTLSSSVDTRSLDSNDIPKSHDENYSGWYSSHTFQVQLPQ